MNNNPFDRAKPPVGINNNLSQESIRAHERDDLDSGSNAHHHSLGPGPNQAAPGDHTHEPRRIGTKTTAVHVVNTLLTTAVTFGKAFKAGTTPRVVLQINDAIDPREYDYEVNSVTNTGFNIVSVRNTGTGALNFVYIADVDS